MICWPWIKGPIERAPEKLVQKKVIKSVWSPYKPDTMELLWKCFEVDFENSKIRKIVKDPEEQEKIKTILWGDGTRYKRIWELYKFYSGLSPANGVPCIGKNYWDEIVKEA